MFIYRISVIVLSALFLTACSLGSSTQNLPVQPTEIFIPTLVPAAFTPVPVATALPCNPAKADFCIGNGNFIFQNPLGPDSPLAIANIYSYGSTDDGKRDPHHGVDIESHDGASVFAVQSGMVVFAGPDSESIYAPWKDYYGNAVVIQHQDGLYTLYGHLSQIFVSAGNKVENGDLIGAVGHAGVATGSHLHFEVRKGGDGTDYFSTQNPELWLTSQDDTGALSITLTTEISHKVQRKIAIWHFPLGADTPDKIYYAYSYPKGFEKNKEDAVLSGLPPGRYRVAFTDETGLYERIIIVEAGKLTQIEFAVK